MHVGLFDDETAAQCHWHVNGTHFLEEWSDARAHDGTASIVQPLIAPLYQRQVVPRGRRRVQRPARSQRLRPGHAVLAGAARSLPAQVFEKVWRKAVHDGVIAGSAPTPKAVGAPRRCRRRRPPSDAGAATRWSFAPDPTILRRPLRQQRLAAGTAQAADEAHVGQRRADGAGDRAKLGVGNGDYVSRSRSGGRYVSGAGVGPAGPCRRCRDGLLRLRPHARGPRRHGHRLQRLRDSHVRRAWSFAGGEVRRTGESMLLASTQGHHSMEGRAIVRTGSLEHVPATSPSSRSTWCTRRRPR